MTNLKIKYFKIIQKNKPLYHRFFYPTKNYMPIGCTIEEINELQAKMNVVFPKAYIEYLYLIGKSHSLFDSGIDSTIGIIEEIQEWFVEERIESGIEINRPVWATDTLDGEQFGFFYLDEKDENPWMHLYTYDYFEDIKDWKEIIVSTNRRLSDYFELRVPTQEEIQQWDRD